MSKDAQEPPDASVWQCQYLRLISFPVEPQKSVQQNWWHELTGTDRESRVEGKLNVEEEGLFEGLSLSLSIDLLRVQWTATPKLSAEGFPDGPPTLGPFLEWKNWFTNHMHRWLATSPPITRLAFAGLLLQPVESREAGYAILDRYLRCVDIDPESTDLLYRVNRPVPSNTDVPELNINRLTTWSVGKFAIVIREQLVGLAAENVGEQVSRSETYACVLELDINTVPEPAGRVLPAETLPRIFDELAELGLDIARRGDIRP